MKVKKKIGLGVLSLATVLGSATAMLSNNTVQVSASETTGFNGLYLFDKVNIYDDKVVNADLIWSDGKNTYYSNWDKQYVFNKDTFSWDDKVWNGDFTSFLGGNAIWTDGNDYYYTTSSVQRILNKETSTWDLITIDNGNIKSFSGSNVWTDGSNTYYSLGTSQCIFDSENKVWNPVTWNGDISYPSADTIWTDGVNMYITGSMGDSYILDKETLTWSKITISGAAPMGNRIWTDGINVYSSSVGMHYIFERETLTWIPKTFDGFNLFSASDVWTDGENYYVYKNMLFSFDYVSEKIYSQEDLDNARQEGIDSVDVTSNDKEIYDKAFADGVLSVGQIEDDIADNVVDVDIEEEKENGFVSFMKWINKYIFFGLFGD